MAESNLPKQDFAPPWLKFPTTDSPKASSHNGYQNERNRPRREDLYNSRADYNRLHRQTSFDFHDAKRYPPGQGKFRHHSIEDDYYHFPFGGYGYYGPNYGYEKFGMQFASQPSLMRLGSRDGKHVPGRYSQGSTKRGYYDKEHQREHRDFDGRGKERNSDRDRPFSEDFPQLKGSGEYTPDVRQTKPGSGVWDNPPKSSRNDESSDQSKNTSGIYKAIVLSKNGQIKKNVSEAARVNGKNGGPLSPSNKTNSKEVNRHSPTPDLAIVTQPKKLADKKSQFLRALRNESSLRNGDIHQDLNQNSIDKKQVAKLTDDDSSMNEGSTDYSETNGNCEHKDVDNHREELENENQNLLCHLNGNGSQGLDNVMGEALIKHVDHIYLSGEEEEKRLLESMGWSEEDQTEYVITDDDVKEFHHMLNRVREESELGNSTKHNVLRLKLKTHFVNGLLNGTFQEHEENNKQESL